MARKIPTEVKILGIPFKIKIVDDLEDYGETNGPENVIKLNKKFSRDKMESTLLHELVHAALYVSGLSQVLDDKMEEGIAICVENALNSVVEVKLNDDKL